MQEFRYLSGVTTLTLDREACAGCGACVTVCPHDVLQLEDGKAVVVDLDGCMECGACALNCPVSSIRVTPGVGCAAYIINKWIKGRRVTAAAATKCG